jgi:hypothetical protein
MHERMTVAYDRHPEARLEGRRPVPRRWCASRLRGGAAFEAPGEKCHGENKSGMLLLSPYSKGCLDRGAPSKNGWGLVSSRMDELAY